MAGARGQGNEFFSAARERAEINLNLAHGNLLTYRYVPVFVFARHARARAFATAERRSLISPRALLSTESLTKYTRSATPPLASETFYLFGAALLRERPFQPDTIPPGQGQVAPG